MMSFKAPAIRKRQKKKKTLFSYKKTQNQIVFWLKPFFQFYGSLYSLLKIEFSVALVLTETINFFHFLGCHSVKKRASYHDCSPQNIKPLAFDKAANQTVIKASLFLQRWRHNAECLMQPSSLPSISCISGLKYSGKANIKEGELRQALTGM